MILQLKARLSLAQLHRVHRSLVQQSYSGWPWAPTIKQIMEPWRRNLEWAPMNVTETNLCHKPSEKRTCTKNLLWGSRRYPEPEVGTRQGYQVEFQGRPPWMLRKQSKLINLHMEDMARLLAMMPKSKPGCVLLVISVLVVKMFGGNSVLQSCTLPHYPPPLAPMARPGNSQSAPTKSSEAACPCINMGSTFRQSA